MIIQETLACNHPRSSIYHDT